MDKKFCEVYRPEIDAMVTGYVCAHYVCFKMDLCSLSIRYQPSLGSTVDEILCSALPYHE